MKKRYRLFRRGKTWWIHDSKPTDGKSCHQSSLKTKDKAEAECLLASLNEPYRFAAYNLQMAKTHLQMSNPDITLRTWQEVMDAVVKTKQGKTRIRYERAVKDSAFDAIRDSVLMETPAEALFDVMANGTVNTPVMKFLTSSAKASVRHWENAKAVVDETTYALAQSKLAVQSVDKRPGHKSEANLLTGVARCGCCNEHNLILHWSGGHGGNDKRNDSRLVCQGAGAGRSQCGFAGAPYALIEKSLLSCLGDADLIRPLLTGQEQKPSRLDELQARLAEAERQANKLARLICDDPEPSPMIYNRLKQEEARAKGLRAEVEQEQLRERTERPALTAYDEFVASLPKLAKDPNKRADLRRAVRNVIERVTLDPRGANVTSPGAASAGAIHHAPAPGPMKSSCAVQASR